MLVILQLRSNSFEISIIKWVADLGQSLVQTIPKWCPWAGGWPSGWVPWVANLDQGQPRPKPRALFLEQCSIVGKTHNNCNRSCFITSEKHREYQQSILVYVLSLGSDCSTSKLKHFQHWFAPAEFRIKSQSVACMLKSTKILLMSGAIQKTLVYHG